MKKSIAVTRQAGLPMILSGLLCVSNVALAQNVKYKYDPSVNFSKYHTYQWVSLPSAHPDQLIDRQIKSAIDGQLAAKGSTQTNSNPDLQVAYQVAVNQEKQWNGWGSGLVLVAQWVQQLAPPSTLEHSGLTSLIQRRRILYGGD